jgi:hypothetical protein
MNNPNSYLNGPNGPESKQQIKQVGKDIITGLIHGNKKQAGLAVVKGANILRKDYQAKKLAKQQMAQQNQYPPSNQAGQPFSPQYNQQPYNKQPPYGSPQCDQQHNQQQNQPQNQPQAPYGSPQYHQQGNIQQVPYGRR